MIGTTLGHYRITDKIGEGGMGEVYRAHDERLDRDVAVKVLPEAVTQDAGRLARFETEAKAVAALNHPNIVTIFSVEEAEGVHFITMELVEGKTLSELIPRKGMPTTKLLGIAIPLANAVSAAHEKEIIHRDLKPDNLMVNDGGMVKILDFGLAKLRGDTEEAPGITKLPTESATQPGRIAGTAAYMSPEQAEGKTIDQRSDIFSLGIVLYEMATGLRPFTGDSTASTLSAILRDTPPPVTELNPALPSLFARIVRRCLVKDPERRYQNVKDLRNELEEVKQDLDSGDVLERAATLKPQTKWKWIVTAAGAIAAAVAVTTLIQQSSRNASTPVQGEFIRITSQVGIENSPSLSPDGAFLAYASKATGNWDIYLQDVGSETAINLTGDSATDDTQPAFSPDGRQIAFRSEREGGGIFLVGSIGGAVRRLTDLGFNPAWSPDGRSVVFSTVAGGHWVGGGPDSQLWTINVQTEEKRLVTESDARHPQWSPHGGQIAYWTARPRFQGIRTISVAGGEPIQVTRDDQIGSNPVWSSDGKHLFFLSKKSETWGIWRLPIEERSGKVLGEPEIVIPFIGLAPGDLTISKEGRQLAFSAYSSVRNFQKVGFSPSTNEIRGEPTWVTRDSRGVRTLSVVPDGGWLAIELIATKDIALVRSDGSDLRQLTNDSFNNTNPIWSPDGKKIAFISDRSGSYEIWTMNRDGSGLEQLTDTPDVRATEPIWSPDGQRMVYTVFRDGSYMFVLNKPWNEQTVQTIGPRMAEEGLMFDADSWSPDGNRLAGVIWHEESGQPKGVAVYTFASNQIETLTEFGNGPRWLNDNRRLLFSHEGKLFLLDSESGDLHELLSSPDFTFLWTEISPDNLDLYFPRSTREADIWTLTLDEER